MCIYTLLKPSYYIPLTTGQILFTFMFFLHVCPFIRVFFCPHFEEERAYYFAHVGRSVCRSFCPSVTFSFPTDKWRTPWPTFLKLCPHIRGQQRNTIDLRSLGQRSSVPKPFPINNSRTPSITFLKPCPHIRVWQQRTLINWFLLHTFVQLILNWLIQLYKTSVAKKNLGGIMFYEHLLFKLHLQAITFMYYYISYKQWILEPAVLWFYM